jgi:transposase-like protein
LGVDDEEVIVPRRYPVAFRRNVLDLIEAGKPVAEVAAQLGVSDQTICNWRRQDQTDLGQRAGSSTRESAELAAARKRIRELETDMAVTKWANELLKARSDSKGAGRSSRRS